MSEHLALRSSVGSRSSALPSHHQRLPPAHDPLASVWIRRLHLTPNPPPPPRPPPLPRRATPPSHQDAVSTDESRTPPPPPRSPPPRGAGFGPLRWSPRPLRGAPQAGAWDAAAAVGGSACGTIGGGGPPMLSPFFRLPAPPPVMPVADFGEVAPVRPLIGLESHSGSSGFPGLSPPMAGGSDPCATWMVARAAGAAYPNHALDMVPIRTLNDLHDRQHGVIPARPNLARHDPSSSSQHDEPFSYWNMGRFRRNTTSSSITPISVAPASFGTKRNADSNNFIPLKLRKLNRAS
ncbi:formin-like protein 14 [Panicum miliaceum]|uniref:Formin-like protein 14 n=1 Tax=Panicum miliaceum TaxID=4540 RepID=A0A3L6TU77_PANMI|nr:formin-like protein 14 [Panicum miliaceum]